MKKELLSHVLLLILFFYKYFSSIFCKIYLGAISTVQRYPFITYLDLSAEFRDYHP